MARSLEPRAAAPGAGWRRCAALPTPACRWACWWRPSFRSSTTSPWSTSWRPPRRLARIAPCPGRSRPCSRTGCTPIFPDRAQRVLHRIEDLRSGRRNDPNFGSRMWHRHLGRLAAPAFFHGRAQAGLNRSRLQLSCDNSCRPPWPAWTARTMPHPPFSHPRLARKRLQGSPCLDRWRRQRYVRGRSPLRAAAAGQLSLFES